MTAVRRAVAAAGDVLRLILTLAVGAGLLFALVIMRSPALGAPTGLSADERLDLAASQLEAATAANGSGFRFTVVATSALHARDGGPLIQIPDPTNPRVAIGTTDHYYIGTSIAAGLATPEGWFMQMRRGPQEEDGEPDFQHAQPTLAGLVTGGQVWRNDGEGWYLTDVAPSIGLDPATLALIPKLLRDATGAKEAGVAFDGPAVRTVVTATGRVADAPGLIAVDLGPRSELVAPVEFQFDGLGRLTLLRAQLRNLNEQTFDLIVETTIRFDWSSAGDLPSPDPVIDPDKTGEAG